MTLDSAPPMRRHPTILDVASHAGVSKSTVSNVVRGLPGVSEATRRRVRSSIRELGYRPNVLANPFFAEMAKSVERHAAARGYTAMFCNTEGDSQSELAGIETLLEHRVAGIVFLAFSGDSRTMQETLQHQVPAVFVSCRAEWGDVVSVDDSFGGRLGTKHLIECGHRRIAFLSVPALEDASDRARWDGYCDALHAAGLGPPAKISWSPPADHARVDGIERTLLDVFTGPDRATAVFASNDVGAIALQEFADRVSLRVPGDISIVGFDDVPMAGLARIALTTVAQPRDELARLGIATIADRIEQRLKGPPQKTVVEVNLVARKSTAPFLTSQA